MPYYKKRTAESYQGKTKEALARQRANLKQNREKDLEALKKEASKFIDQKKKLKDQDIIQFAENPVILGLSFKKRPAQKVILRVL